MTRVDFYFNVADRNETACRIAAKALRSKLRIAVYAPDENVARAVDRLMWMRPPTGFLPHCRADSPLAAQTPVVIAMSAEALPDAEVLLNLDHETPSVFSRFQRLVEIVGTAESDRASARSRFRFYRDRGYEIANHDLAIRQPDA